ncbi:MAG: FRG domain-containing protein [Bombella apis]|uniref:FRG domain-containing protein n=1 Tax=Bombella apis TaxID=1785988 RepID=UPI0023F4C667|nr:FRG domain-containing protein [Bombella apis]MCT6819480.1 FRG domain-containing protein [Bombella apis]
MHHQANNTVESLADFLRIIKERKKIEEKELSQDTKEKSFFYRGQSNYSWTIKPSIFRKPELHEKEEYITTESMLRLESEFSRERTLFEKLVKMQHFGIPTRLLDVTTSPLTALFFACQEHISDHQLQTDGMVFIWHLPFRDFPDTPTVVVKSHLSRLRKEEKDELKSVLKKYFGSIDNEFLDIKNGTLCSLIREKVIVKLTSFANQDIYLPKIILGGLNQVNIVRPTWNNTRITAQQGWFMILGFEEIIEKLNERTIYQKIRIPASCKENILKELDYIGVNHLTLFPDLHGMSQYIKNRF